ncbi:5'-3' exonuclease [Rhizocola hellebori]|uniref:5'-3' exonuclease n=1 Tax=Rhizocola hellebori TaxID=1392758 RepID=UPI001944435E|nr:5'-3' exonuclease H3TH domain-containing protein [Rhizocola hellebori]
MQAPPAPLLLVLDGNSLLHRAYHAASTEPLWDPAGRPVWALKGLVSYIARAAAHLRPDAVMVGFDCPDHSARKADYPEYKAHRAEKPVDLASQIVDAPQLLQATGICTVVPPSYEADDVLASGAEHARRHGWRSVLMTSDRDAFALIDQSTSVLRVRNGGFDEAVLVDPAGLADLCGVEPWQYRDFAALRGDPSDNLRGVHHFGSTTAARLLAAFGSVEAAFAAIDRGDGQTVRDVVGERATEQLGTPAMRENVARNRRIMRMRTDLPLPELDTARLPLDLAHMRRVLSARGINLGPSLWAITGGAPPPSRDQRHQDTRPWMVRPRRRGRYDPIPGQLTLF